MLTLHKRVLLCLSMFFLLALSNHCGSAGTENSSPSSSTTTDTNSTLVSSNANLANLTTSAGTLSPIFSANVLEYEILLDFPLVSIQVTPTLEDLQASVKVQNQVLSSGTASQNILLNEGENVIQIEVQAADGRTTRIYTLQIRNRNIFEFVQRAHLKAPNSSPSLLFGNSVALSGDTLVVGVRQESSDARGVDAPADNTNAPSSGAAYVFVRDSNRTWHQEAYLKASNTGDGDQFGGSVAISGDTIVVGARFENSNAMGVNGNQNNEEAPLSGAAYVFVRDASHHWRQQAYLKASNTGRSHGFGTSVSIYNDTIVVGSPYENGSANGSGAAYIFIREGTYWHQQAYLKASNIGNSDHFGTSVSIFDETLTVGAPYEDSNGNPDDNSQVDSGAAYIFKKNSQNIWQQQAYLKASNISTVDHFGKSISIFDDTVVVGVPDEDGNERGAGGGPLVDTLNFLYSGAVYIFVRDENNQWHQQAYLKASNTEAYDNFGTSVSIFENNLIVGAPGEDSDGNQHNNDFQGSGAAYVFTRDHDTWGIKAYLKASNIGIGYSFGYTVAASDDFTFAVGSIGDNSIHDGGGVYIFERNP